MDRIRAKTVQDRDCLVWTGYCTAKGYGQVSYNGQMWGVHRLVWILTNGDTELCVLHTCYNPPCWNIEHLFVGTNYENVQDMVKKGRQARGSKIAQSKLTEAQAIEIIRDYKPYINTLGVLAKKYDVDSSTINRIILGNTWSTVACTKGFN